MHYASYSTSVLKLGDQEVVTIGLPNAQVISNIGNTRLWYHHYKSLIKKISECFLATYAQK